MTAAPDSTRPLRIAIDAQVYPNSGTGGVVSVLIGLVHALGRLEDGPEEYVIVGPRAGSDWWSRYTGPNQRIVSEPVPGIATRVRNRVRRTVRAPLAIPRSQGFYEGLGCDVVHFPYPSFTVCDLPMVYNPHDLQHLHLPRFFTPEAIAERETTYRAGCARADTVVVASDWIQRDIAAKYGVPESRLQVIPWAPPTVAYGDPTPETLERVRRELDLPERFALYPAMTWPHKNHLGLLEALARVRDRHGLTVPLVCTGKKNAFWGEIEKRIEALALGDQVRFPGIVPADTLRALYSLATFAVLPTWFEAASAPLFEAWQAGLPAAVSTVTSLPEQAGDAALLFDPYDTDAMAEAIARLYGDPALRQELRERGRVRLHDFSWERTAKAYRAVYRRAAGRPSTEEDERLLAWDWMRDRGAPGGSEIDRPDQD